jgi:FAD/FMN-containing dehydrogenase
MSLDDLRAAVSGAVIAPGDAEWDAARLFHSGIGEPDAVVRAGSADDVRAAVRWAAGVGVAVMVRGGGHSAWGGLPGGLTIDIAGLDGIDVDGDLVRVGGGATWGAVAHALAPLGLGISSGDTASVGVGGLTLGGGIGWMVRAWGLAADQLVGAQVVTAEGEVVEVGDASHPDLLWALRGGGGNFGVVTRFDFRAHALPSVVVATYSLEGDARPALQALAALLPHAPRELTVTYMDVPAIDPSAPAGATITACWAGDDEDAAGASLESLHGVAGVTETEMAVRAYPQLLLEMPPFDPQEPMPGFIGGNTLLTALSVEAIDRLAAFREARPASVVFLRSLGGAYADVPADATAWAARDATWFAMAGAFDIPGAVSDAERADTRAEWAAIDALGIGVYGNFTTSTDPEWVPRIYPEPTLERLRQLKRTWDPGNVFSRNHNVVP